MVDRITTVKMIRNEEGGIIKSYFEEPVDEFILGTMLIELIGERNGCTNEETAEHLLGAINASEPSKFNIKRGEK